MTTDFTFERAAAWAQVGEALELALEAARRAEDYFRDLCRLLLGTKGRRTTCAIDR